ncbi:MAG: hypothetical protein ABIG42_11410 [bacterium]
MNIKLSPRYPPEIPAVIAKRVKSSSGFDAFSYGVLLGPSLPDKIKNIITSRKNTLDAGKENESLGFHLINGGDNPNIICYSCDEDELTAVLERMSVAIHAFKWLGVEFLMIIDRVTPFNKFGNDIVCIDDYINMTGENPLDYWMMTNEPDEVFLDTKSLYRSVELNPERPVVHLATVNATSSEIIQKAGEFNAATYGRAFVPESLIAGYLGMKITALGLLDTTDMNNFEKISKILLELIKKNPPI